MPIKKVAVVGAGTMGACITVALTLADFPVFLKDINHSALEQGLTKIDSLLKSQVRRGLSIDEAQRCRSLVTPVTDYTSFAQADLVIEAVAEDFAVKKAVFLELDKHCTREALLATNTSSLSITRIAAATSNPARVLGLHFFNPAHLMSLVEIIPGLETSPVALQTAIAFGQALGKLAIVVGECPSFLVNRLLGRYMNEALWSLQEGVAGVEEIDKAACDFAMPVGPLLLRDMNGADIGLAVASLNYQEYGERFCPAPILQEMVQHNLLGKKTGKGFYVYPANAQKPDSVNPELESLLRSVRERFNQASPRHLPFAAERLFLPMINEAFLVLQENICKAEELDPALMAGLGMRKGPLTLACEIGLSECLAKMEKFFACYGERFRPAFLLKRYVWAARKTVIV